MKKILVIDDMPERQEWFGEMLDDLDIDDFVEVHTAMNDTEALAKFREHTFDLAFFDHDLGMMAEKSGSGVAFHILNNPEEFNPPKSVWVHSQNYEGAKNIAAKFESVGVPCRIQSFLDCLHDEGYFKELAAKMLLG